MPRFNPTWSNTSRNALEALKLNIIEDISKKYVVDVAPVYAKVSEYLEPLQCKIEMWDLKKLEKRFDYNSFDTRANQVIIESCTIDLGIDTHGSFTFRIFDADKFLDSKLLKRRNLVIISAKKYGNEPFTNLLYGMQTKMKAVREDTGMLQYDISGIGTGSILNERVINFNKVARPESLLSSNPYAGDQTMAANNLLRKLFVDPSVYVVDDVTMAEQLNIDMSLLEDSEVRDILGGINQPYVDASQVYNAILESVGAQGGVNANNQAYLRYPSDIFSGTKIKAWDYENDDENLDFAANTSYFMGPFEYEVSWAKEDGFVNRWYSKGRTQQISASSGTTGVQDGFVPTFERDLAQKFRPNASNLRDLALMLQKVGDGTSDPVNTKYLHGHITLDNNGAPNGSVLAYFNIPLTDIPTTMGPVYLSNLTLNFNIDASQDLWIILYDRGDDDTNTIHWGVVNNPDAPSTNAVRYYHRSPPDSWVLDHFNGSGWEIHPGSFSFMYSAFDSFTNAVIAEDPDSIERYGIVEDVINVEWAPNTNIVNRFISERLAITALPKVVYNANTVTIPGNIFLPGQIISIEDKMSDLPNNLNIKADILAVRYNFGGSSAEFGGQLGALFTDISPVGLYDFRQEEEEEG
jgi:hypothetical protein